MSWSSASQHLHTHPVTVQECIHVYIHIFKNKYLFCYKFVHKSASFEKNTNEILLQRERTLLSVFSPLLGSSFPRNPLTYQKGGFLEILFLGAGLINHFHSAFVVWEVADNRKTLDEGSMSCQSSCEAVV